MKIIMNMFFKEKVERIKKFFEEYKIKGKDEFEDFEDSDLRDEENEVQLVVFLVFFEDKVVLM